MKIIRRYPLIVVLIIANLAGLAFYAQRNFVQAQRRKEKQAKASRETADRFDKANFMHKDDYLHLRQMGQPIHDAGVISDADLQWCLDMLRTNPNPGNINGKVPMQLMVTGPLMMYVKTFTPHQKDMLFDYSSQALRGDGGNAGNEYIIAINFMRKTGDKRIAPYLCLLLNHPKESIRKAARKTLVQLGEPLPVAEAKQ